MCILWKTLANQNIDTYQPQKVLCSKKDPQTAKTGFSAVLGLLLVLLWAWPIVDVSESPCMTGPSMCIFVISYFLLSGRLIRLFSSLSPYRTFFACEAYHSEILRHLQASDNTMGHIFSGEFYKILSSQRSQPKFFLAPSNAFRSRSSHSANSGPARLPLGLAAT